MTCQDTVISDEVREAVESRIGWIKTVTRLGLEHAPTR